MISAALKKNQLFFPLNKEKFLSIVKTLQNNENYEDKLSTFSKSLGEKRSTIEMVKRLEHILVPAQSIEAEVGVLRPATAS